jgi:DNA (cytosine-5)-methyltransferase 1
MKFRLGEFFSGPGGLAKGAFNAKARNGQEIFSVVHSWANDYDKDSCETYRQNLCKNRPESVICQDVKTLDLSSLGEIDAFAFGFPCNDFSLVGEKKGINGTFGPLYSHGVRALRKFRPMWFIAENVGGIRSSNEGQAFETILNELRAVNYNLSVHLYKFEEYGVPQSRHRVIIVGIDRSLGLHYRVPRPSGVLRTCKQALIDPPIPPTATNQELTKQAARVVERLQHIRPGENAWNSDLPSHLKLNVKGA